MKNVNVRDFDTIQAAVNDCAENGGGTVAVPRGEWRSGPIHLRSNVELHLEDDAVISFSDRFVDYLPVVFTRWEGVECYNYSPLIYANGCENISVTGKGTLLGNGGAWWPWKKGPQQAAARELYFAQSSGLEVAHRVYGTEKAALRPSFIQPVNCKNILLEGFTVKDGPMWTLHPVYCENVTVRNVKVLTTGPNTDGLNPDSCKNVLIEGCSFSTGDDCIAINSGMNEDGWRVNRPCENIEIRNCTMNGGHGAVVIGSAMSGGVRNVYFHDCKIKDTMQGIRLKSMRGRGGYVEDVRFENIEINNTTNQAIQINMFYEFATVEPASDVPPSFHNIEIKNVCGENNETGILINGLPEQPLDRIALEHIDLGAGDGFRCSNVKNIKINDVVIRETK